MPRTLSRLLLPVAVLLGSVTLPGAPAVAQDACASPGGVDGSPPISAIQYEDEDPTYSREVSRARTDPFAEDAHDIVVSGGGWGHGVGMSQYGAQGAAQVYGCDAGQILSTYYPNTSIEGRPSRDTMRLKLWTTDGSGVSRVWAEEQTRWRTCEQDDSGATVPGSCTKLVDQPGGSSVTVSLTADGWRVQGDEIDAKSEGGRTHSLLEMRHDGKLIRVLQGRGDPRSSGRAIRYGTLEFDFTSLNSGRLFTTEVIDSSTAASPTASGMTAMETYLLGIAEVPWSWNMEALRAQVIAARSYAESRIAERRANYTDAERIRTLDCRCDLVVTTGDQVWLGEDKVLAEPSYFQDKWKPAVVGTAGSYVVQNGRVFTTFYSSSHGGVSRAGFTSSTPGYTSVDASRWEKASGNPRYRWSQGFSREQLQSAFGIDDIDEIAITQTDRAGYPMPGGVRIRGVDNGQAVEWTYSPDSVRTRLGLYAPRFAIHEIRDLADDTQIPVDRLSGDTRSDTAIRLSTTGWPNGADTVVIARQDDPADALTGSALAGTHDAPLLLTPRTGLTAAVRAEIERLEPGRAFLLGGDAALDERVRTDVLEAGVPSVERVAGPSRFSTAVDVATEVARGGQTTAYLVRLRDAQVASRGWVDALSVAAVAARRAGDGAGWPILGTEATLPDETRRAIGDLGIERVVPVGGSATVPQAVLDELASMGVEVADRLAGADRYGTSRAVTASDSPTAQSLVIATGENFPDGLAAGPFAARTGAALLLVPTGLHDGSPWGSQEHPAFIRDLGWADPSLVAVGGSKAITNSVVHRVSNLLEGGAS